MNFPSTPQEIDGNLHGSRTQSVARATGLVAVRTKGEAQATVEVTHAYIVLVAPKSANTLLRAIDDALPQPTTTTVTLQHLRRFAKASSLPVSIRRHLSDPLKQAVATNHASDCEANLSIYGPSELGTKTSLFEDSFLCLLVCAATTLSRGQAQEILASMSSAGFGSFPCLYTIPVPANAPTSAEQALQWSRDYWPTVYKKHNPYGPHPSIVARAEELLQPLAAEWMTLAQKIGVEASESSIGECIGTVVVDPVGDRASMAVVAAGDARWQGDVSKEQQSVGNIMAHAVMRAIAMVARKRREAIGTQERDSRNDLVDYPITTIEQTVFSQGSVQAGGYLCTELEIFVTHEPCVMCSMAILHSRFSKVVFATRMPRTGGLTAEIPGGLGYGLLWLPELNWKLMAWQWLDEESEEDMLPTTDVHA